MITTITLNPTFDRHLYLADLVPFEQNRAVNEIVCAGGKGVNVSRVLGILGSKNVAFAALGEFGKEEYIRFTQEDGIDLRAHHIKGLRVRSNTVVHSSNGRETGISTDSFTLTPAQLTEILGKIVKIKSEYTVFSGRIPKGLSKDDVKSFLSSIAKTGTLLTVDSSSLSFDDIAEIRPWLIKPNRREISDLGFEVSDCLTARKAAEALLSKGIKNVIVSLDGDGGVYVGEYGAFKILVPKIDSPVSTVGAGDSTVAGFISAISNGEGVEKALALAFACGTAACMTEATLPPQREQIEKTVKEITVTAI